MELTGAMLQQHAAMMNELKAKQNVLTELIGARNVHYIDIPVHNNVGDLLIFEGTLEFIRNNKIRVKNYISEFTLHDRNIDTDDVLLMHGGGNLGDLYPHHQQVKEHYLRKFPRNRIIILPQTAHFQSTQNYKDIGKLFRQHNDLHICLRDEKSFELAKELSDKLYRLPDMAHQLYPLMAESKSSPEGTLVIGRTDDEKGNLDFQSILGVHTDWPEIIQTFNDVITSFRAKQKSYRKYKLTRFTANPSSQKWIQIVAQLTSLSADYFAKYEKVVTNRLHGHIFSCLLNIPNVVVDNSYGKNYSYMKAWTGTSPLTSYYPES